MLEGDPILRYFMYLILPGHSTSFEFAIYFTINTMLYFYCGYKMYRNYSNAGLMQDIPTSNIRSAPQGYIELTGTIFPCEEEPLISPLLRKEVLWYHSRIYCKKTIAYRDYWSLLEEKISDASFLLKDSTGECLIKPQGAEVLNKHYVEWFGAEKDSEYNESHSVNSSSANFMFSERYLLPDSKLYAIGVFSSTKDLNILSIHNIPKGYHYTLSAFPQEDVIRMNSGLGRFYYVIFALISLHMIYVILSRVTV